MSSDDWKLGDWTTQINEAHNEIKELKELNKKLKSKVIELLQELTEAEKRIEKIEHNNRSHLQHIEQLEIEVREAADEITDDHIECSQSLDHQHKTLPTTACLRQPPRKSIINFLI